MFARDAVSIRRSAEVSPEVNARVLIFAIVTANAPLRAAVNAALWLRARDFSALAYGDLTIADKSYMGAAMTSAKLAHVQHVWANRETLYEQYRELDAVSFWNLCIDTVPGLGMVKAAFVVQMLYGELGCIDVHNLRVLGLDRKAVTGKSRVKRDNYLNIQAAKSSEVWWNEWCNLVATRYPGQFDSGDYVSRLHYIATVGV